MFQQFMLDSETGWLATDSTPQAHRLSRVYQVLPQEARDWAVRHGIDLYLVTTSRAELSTGRERAECTGQGAGQVNEHPRCTTVINSHNKQKRESRNRNLTSGALRPKLLPTYIIEEGNAP